MTAFPAPDAFRAAYPEQPAKLRHTLSDHPLLALDALAGLAGRLDPAHIEYNRADLPVGLRPEDTPDNGLSIADTVRTIADNGSWMVMKWVENDGAYRALLEDTLADIRPLVRDATGEMLKLEGFIFLSSPNAVTPFHFDPEHNILLQIRGAKTMTVFPADDREIAPAAEHERYHMGGHRNLPWNESWGSRGKDFPLGPGEAVYVPVKAPHFVRNGPEPSVSFSVTWRSEWSYRESAAHGFNHSLRRIGIDPAPPARFPRQNRAKALGWSVLHRLGL